MMKVGREYKVGESGSWNWFGVRHWWVVSVKVSGFNGSGGYWIEEFWRWDHSAQIMTTEIRTLSWEESRALDRKALFWLKFKRIEMRRSR